MASHDDSEDSDIVEALPVDDIPVVDPDYTDAIETALRLLLKFDTEHLADTTDRIVRAGIDRALALRLVQLIPIAWGRFILHASGVHIVTDEYHLLDRRTRKSTRKRFSDDMLYQQIRDVLPDAMMRYHRRHFTGLAMRSTEVTTVKKMLRDGTSPGGGS
jgi:hypothetical protein